MSLIDSTTHVIGGYPDGILEQGPCDSLAAGWGGQTAMVTEEVVSFCQNLVRPESSHGNCISFVCMDINHINKSTMNLMQFGTKICMLDLELSAQVSYVKLVATWFSKLKLW